MLDNLLDVRWIPRTILPSHNSIHIAVLYGIAAITFSVYYQIVNNILLFVNHNLSILPNFLISVNSLLTTSMLFWDRRVRVRRFIHHLPYQTSEDYMSKLHISFMRRGQVVQFTLDNNIPGRLAAEWTREWYSKQPDVSGLQIKGSR